MTRRGKAGSCWIAALLLILVPLASCDDAYNGDLAKERAKHTTNLTKKGPAPQEAPSLPAPPAGARAVLYPSDGRDLKAWISVVPAGSAKKRPAVVYCHGGFAFGEDDWDQAELFRKAGYVVMMPMLRGENGNPGSFELFYGEVDDAVAAGKYLAAWAGVDPSRVYIAGHSAGGTIACLAALVPSPFAAAAAYGATTDAEEFLANGSPFRAIAPFDPSDAKELRLRSAVRYIKTLRCPLYLFAGASDRYAQHAMLNMDTLARSAGETCQTFVVDGDHHSAVPESIDRTINLFSGISRTP